MTDELAANAAGIGALAEPLRRALYRFVVAQPDAVGREQAAAGVGVPPHSAKFHLDRLVAEGLLEVEYRRLTGRTGPGAGRPAKLYRRAQAEVSVSLPERRYDLAGHILAEAVDRAGAGGDVREAVRDAAAGWGRRLVGEYVAEEPSAPSGDASSAHEHTDGVEGEMARLAAVLARQGYEPRLEDGDLALVNCPFDALAREHTALVCGLNVSLVEAMVGELGCTRVAACLDPRPGRCCVRARPAR